MYYRLHPHIVKKDSDFDWVERSKTVWEPFEFDYYVELGCPSCNAKIITRSSTAASVCPFCGNAVIKSSNFKGDIRPDKVVPFKIPKQVFADKYLNYISDIRFIPKEFKDKAVINKQLAATYLYGVTAVLVKQRLITHSVHLFSL